MPGRHYEASDYRWNYTSYMADDTRRQYEGRPIITRDSAIDGGVFYTGSGTESAVVDTQQYPEEFNNWYDQACDLASDSRSRIDRTKVLRSVFETVSRNMAYSLKGVEQLGRELNLKPNQKVTLNAYMKRGTGVCRHQALATGVLLEMFKNDSLIRGTPRVHKSSRPDSGHAWVRYTSHGGVVAILDVAHGQIGRLDSIAGRAQWDYRLPEEI